MARKARPSDLGQSIAPAANGDGYHALPDIGTLSVTGSVSSLSDAVPSAACDGACVLPTNTISYPVHVTTAPSSPPPSTLADASPGTGTGTVVLGGSGSADPLGWWISVPATAYVGSYSSAVTLAVASGP